jgi:hypothetical protein
MNRRQTMSSVATDDSDYIIYTPSISMKNRLRNFFGFPKPVDDEHIDNNRYSWCMLII